ncbi:MAG: hypothetical protein M9904_14100 [Chitinophagaceae bacterium]|nr:hypothetical protein [Chitinophagaceae bacterium]MCO5241179.1 hypothetical protein [Chitinophagaceae bacterium]
MNKITILILCILLYGFVADAQITKGIWMVGGNASFSSLKKSDAAGSARFKQTNIQLSPVIGYFFFNKFTGGLRPSLTYGSNTVSASNTLIGIGPFTRFYFLDPENILNLFLEGSYSYGSMWGKGQISNTSNTFSISGGPVIYFNTSVGLEFSLAYSTTKVTGYSERNNELSFEIGFRFHLEKDK